MGQIKMHQMHLAVGLSPDPLGELTALPHTPRLTQGKGERNRHEGRGTAEEGNTGKG